MTQQAASVVGIFGQPVGRRLGWLVMVPRCPEPFCGGVHHHRLAALEDGTTVTRRCPKTGREYTVSPSTSTTLPAPAPLPQRAWPSREEWAADRRTCYGDDVDKILSTVSADPADYATDTELAAAAEELRLHWCQLGYDLREANAAARATFPRFRPHGGPVDYYEAIDALPADQRAIVDHAATARDHRARIRQALTEMTDPRRRSLGTWNTGRVLKTLPSGRCPLWRSIVETWQAARAAAADDYRAHVAQRPVDDAAWAQELDRRTRIDATRAVVWTGTGARRAC